MIFCEWPILKLLYCNTSNLSTTYYVHINICMLCMCNNDELILVLENISNKTDFIITKILWSCKMDFFFNLWFNN